MSITRIYSVFCDIDGCSQWTAEHLTMNDARRAAKEYGWGLVRQEGRLVDLCPEHLAASQFGGTDG